MLQNNVLQLVAEHNVEFERAGQLRTVRVAQHDFLQLHRPHIFAKSANVRVLEYV